MKHQSAPAWTISPRRPVKATDLAPGPGAYDVGSSLKGASVRVGSSQRSELAVKTSTPGPGAYDPAARPSSSGAV